MRKGKYNASYYILYETQYEHIPGIVKKEKEMNVGCRPLTENTFVQQRAVINQNSLKNSFKRSLCSFSKFSCSQIQ